MSTTAMRRFGAVLVCLALAIPSSALAQKRGARKRAAKPVPAAVVRDLASADVAVATRAAGKLGADSGAPGLSALLDALALGLHPQVSIAVLDAVASHASATAVDTLVRYSRHRNPKVRAKAVAALGTIDEDRADKAVLAALRDGNGSVRARAAGAVATRKIKGGAEILLSLLGKGDEAAAKALAEVADAELAMKVAESIGSAPDSIIAQCLGTMLSRASFGPEEARLEVVRALGRVPGQESLEQLTSYVASVPENPPRQSRSEAETIIETRLGGGQ